MNILLLLFLEAIIIGLFVAITIQMTIALDNCKKLRKDIEKNDPGSSALKNAQQAQNLLGWGVAIGWTAIGLAVLAIIIIVIVEIFGGAEAEGVAALAGMSEAELAALAAEGGESLAVENAALNEAEQLGVKGVKEAAQSSEEVKDAFLKYGQSLYRDKKISAVLNSKRLLAEDIENLNKEAKGGFFYFYDFINFDGFYNGFKSLFFLASIGTLLGLGILSAWSANDIINAEKKYSNDGYTYDKKHDGHHEATNAALIGILPAGIVFVWFLANEFYVRSAANRAAADAKKLNEQNQEILKAQATLDEEHRALQKDYLVEKVKSDQVLKEKAIEAQRDIAIERAKRGLPPPPKPTRTNVVYTTPPPPPPPSQASSSGFSEIGKQVINSPQGQQVLTAASKAAVNYLGGSPPK